MLNLIASSVGKEGENLDVVAFGDLNHFHNFNKQHGSTIGDAAIAHVGRLIDELFVDQCRAKAFRKGGDEFVYAAVQSEPARVREQSFLIFGLRLSI